MTGSLATWIHSALERFADREAVSGPARWTYADLAEAAYATAARLGPDPRRAIGIATQRTPEAYAAVLATLLSGNYFVPLNPRQPLARAREIRERAGIGLVLTDEPNRAFARELGAEVLPVERGKGWPAAFPEVSAEDRAYIQFTSGSTGRPKGVVVTRGNIEALLRGLTAAAPATPNDRFTQIFELSFDLAIGEILWALTSGACLCPFEAAQLPALVSFLERERITVWGSGPTFAQNILATRVLGERGFPSVRFSLFCGERLDQRVARFWHERFPKSVIANFYGPTEATVYVTQHLWQPSEAARGSVPIGRPLAGSEVLLLGDDGQDVHGEEVGEIYLGGPQVAAGYLEEPDDAAFVTLPGRPGRWFRTRDQARRDAGGELVFTGRRDRQVKVLGQRVELEEVEAILGTASPEASWSVLPFPCDDFGSARGVVAVVDQPLAPELARRALGAVAERLPAACVPNAVYLVKTWPQTTSGKRDTSRIAEVLREAKRIHP